MNKFFFLLLILPIYIRAKDLQTVFQNTVGIPLYGILPNDSIVGQIETGPTFHKACVKRSYPNAYFFIFREIDVKDSVQLNGFYLQSNQELKKLQRTIANNLYHKKRITFSRNTE